MITSTNDKKSLKHILHGVTEALKLGCFNLRKLKTNLPSIFDSINLNISERLTLSESSSTLGLGWELLTDTLYFPMEFPTSLKYKTQTKRSILSNVFKIFDPLGLLSPSVVQTKIILQQLWLEKLGWDDPIPENISINWSKFIHSLSILNTIKIPRHVLCDEPILIQLHCFCDASQGAYGACIYLRSVNASDEVTVSLLRAKSKVAPIKPTTISRLAFCAPSC